MPNIKYRISLEGGDQVSKELLTVEQSIKKLQDAAKSGTGADTFASTTAAISKLGSTTQEALGAAAAAAQKFGASANELARVEGVIKALDGRARDSSTAFATLAQNYDKARASASGLGQAIAGQAVGMLAAGRSAEKAAAGFAVGRREIMALGAAFRGLGLGSVAASLTPLAAVGSTFGVVAVGVTAIGVAVAGTIGLTIKFAEALANTSDEALKLGVSFKQFEQLRQSLQGLGISAQGFSAAMAKVKGDLDKFKLDQIAKEAAGVKKAMEAGTLSVPQVVVPESIGKAAEQLRSLKTAAEEFGPIGTAARQALIELGVGIPGTTRKDVEDLGADLAKLKNFGVLGINIKIDDDLPTRIKTITDAITKMQDTVQRTQIAKQFLGEGPGTELIQKLKAQEGTLTEQEAKAIKLKTAITQLSDEWDRFGSVTFADKITSGVGLITEALRTLQAAMNNLTWDSFTKASEAAFKLITGFIRNFTVQGIGQQLAEKLVKLSGELIRPAGAAEAGGGQQLGGADFGPMIAAAEVAAVRIKAIFADALSGSVAAMDFSAVTNAAQTAATELQLLFSTAAQQITSSFSVAPPDFSTITTAAQTVATELQQLFFTAAQQITETFASIDISTALIRQIDVLIAKFNELAAAAKAAPGSGAPAGPDGGPAPTLAGGGLLRGRGTGTSDSNLAWLSRGEYIMPARAVAQPGVLAFLEALRRSGRIPGFAEGGFIRGAVELGGGGIADKIGNWIVEIAQANNAMRTALTSLADALTGKLFAVVSDMTSELNRLNRIGGNARGGLLGGRGTGMSDSNLAWVSRGEHIMPARAVAQPGVLAFLEALRRSGGNLRDVLDGMGRFALGGMVPRVIPAFATGGLAGGNNVTIQFPGLPAIGGLRASSDVVDQLHKAAALAQVRSGGRKPSRYS